MKYFNAEDLLPMFASSEDADTIAQDFTRALNDAIKIQKQKEQEEAEKRAAEAKRKEAEVEKIADMQTVVRAILEFGNKHYKDLFEGFDENDLDAKALIASTDVIYNEYLRSKASVENFLTNMEKTCGKTASKETSKPVKEKKTDPLEQFLKEFNLI